VARTRYIKPGFFQNDRLAELGPWHRLLFAGLWTIADRAGRIEDRPKRIKGELFPYDDVDVDALLADLSSGDDPFVVRYEAGGVRCLCLPKWLLHQKPHNNEAPSILPSHRNYKKTEEKTEFEPKSEPSTTKARTEDEESHLDSHLNENSNENSNREWATGTGNAVPASAPLDGGVWRQGSRSRGLMHSPIQHAKCYPSRGCNRGLCIPRFVADEWLGQCAGDAALVGQFIDATLQATPEGPQGDPVKFWRAQWDVKHRTPMASTKGARTVAAGNRLQAALDAGAKPDPFGLNDYHEEQRQLEAKRLALKAGA
jgi:hypothetical protein